MSYLICLRLHLSLIFRESGLALPHQHWHANSRIENKSHMWVTHSSDLVQHYGVAITFRTYILFTCYCYIWTSVPPRDVLHLDHFCPAPLWSHWGHFKALSQNCRKKILASSCMSVLLSTWNNTAPTEQIFMKFDIWVFSKVCRENSNFIKIWQE